MTAVTAATKAPRRPRREPELTFLRLVPRDSPMHRLWAGTKLIVAAIVALVASISPTWPMLGMAGAVVLLELVVGRIPIGAFPRLPRWFFGVMAVGGVLSMLASVEPVVEVGGFQFSLGGLEQWGRFTVLAVVLIVSGLVIGWTTPLGDVAPAVHTLGAPLRWLRLPIDEWVVAIALAFRCLPLLIDEIRTLMAARRLRSHEEGGVREQPEKTLRQLIMESHDLLATAIVTSIRRARDLAEAMMARGGVGGSVSVAAARKRPGIVDAIVLTTVLAVGVVSLVVLHL
jgi:energy-coupling factor transporter transmembrane protein EcfT